MQKNRKILWIAGMICVWLSFLLVWHLSRDKEDMIKNTTSAALTWIFLFCAPLLHIQVWPPPKVEGDKQQITRDHYLHYRRLTKIISIGLVVMFFIVWLGRLVIDLILADKYHYFCPTPSIYGLIFILMVYCLPWAIFYLTCGIIRLTRQNNY